MEATESLNRDLGMKPGYLGHGRVLLILGFSLAAGALLRFSIFQTNFGETFVPWPDAVEYVAGAQTIADQGRFFLQLGAFEVRPRYAPGLSMLLALPLALGVEATDLWRYKAALGSLLAGLLGVSVASVLVFRGHSANLGLVFGLFATLFWLILPINLFQASMILADEVAALLLFSGLALLAVAQIKKSSSPGVAAMAGLALGTVAITRFVGLLLLIPSVVLVIAACWHEIDRRRLGRILVIAGVASLLPILAAAWLLHSSGFPPFELTAYRFWVEKYFSHWQQTFNLDYALQGHARSGLPGGEVQPHLHFGAEVLLGLPSVRSWDAFGKLWPAMAWLCGLVWLVKQRVVPAKRTRTLLMAAALGAVPIGHLIFFSLYAFLSGRFYGAPLLICALVFWTAIAELTRRGKGSRLLAALILSVTVWGIFETVGRAPLTLADLPNPNPTVLAAYRTWLGQSDLSRQSSEMPFDPLRVQALGGFKAAEVARIHLWGRLPMIEHTRRLSRHGLLDKHQNLTSKADGRYIHLSPIAGTLRPLVHKPERFEATGTPHE